MEIANALSYEPWLRLHGDLPHPKLRTLLRYCVGSWVFLLCTNRRSNDRDDRWQCVLLNHLHVWTCHPNAIKKCLYDQWLYLRWLVALLFDFVGLSRTWRNIDSEGDCYLWMKTSRMTRYENVLIYSWMGIHLLFVECGIRRNPCQYFIWFERQFVSSSPSLSNLSLLIELNK